MPISPSFNVPTSPLIPGSIDYDGAVENWRCFETQKTSHFKIPGPFPVVLYSDGFRPLHARVGGGTGGGYSIHQTVIDAEGLVAELHFYDFDGTLFRSPLEPAVWDRGWWNNPESLLPPCVPDRPDSSWWIGSTVSKAKRSIGDSNVYAVMATGRPAASGLRFRVPELLQQKGLNFDEVHLAPPKDTLAWKKGLIAKLLSRYPFIDAVKFWDDRASHLPEFERVALKAGIEADKITATLVRSRLKAPECDDLDDVVLKDTQKKPSYLGLFLDAKSKADLIQEFSYLHDKPQASHVTLILKPTEDQLSMIGEKGSAIVTGYAADDKGQAVLVKLSPNLPLQSGKIPHVTLSVAPGVKPQYSNELIKGVVQKVKGIRLQGVVDVHPRRLSPGRLTQASPSRVAARWLNARFS